MPSTVFPQFGIRKIIVGLPQREIQEDKPATWFTSVGCTVQEGSQERRVVCSIFRIKVLLLSSPTSLIGDPGVFVVVAARSYRAVFGPHKMRPLQIQRDVSRLHPKR